MSQKRFTDFKWSREFTLALIEIYKKYPCMYASSTLGYHKKIARNNALANICSEFNAVTPANLNVRDIQRKLHVIRTQYLGELQRFKKRGASSLSSDRYTPKLWCFDHLTFLSQGAVVGSQEDANISTIQIQYNNNNVDDRLRVKTVYNEQVNDINKNKEYVCTNGVTTMTYLNSELRSTKLNALLETAVSSLEALKKEDENPINNNNANKAFSLMVEAELNNIRDEEVLDQVKQTILDAIFKGKHRGN